MQLPQHLHQVPRLSILHLLLWMVVTSVLQSSYILTKYNIKLEMPVVLPDLADQLISGTALSGFFIIAWHWLARSLWPLESGEYLIVATGLVSATIMLWRFLSIVFLFMRPESSMLSFSFFHLTIGLLYISIAISIRRQERWPIVLLLTAMSELGLGVAGFPLGIGYVLGCLWMLFLVIEPLILIVVLSAAVIEDRTKGLERHWLHWVGVAVFGCGAIVRLARFL